MNSLATVTGLCIAISGPVLIASFGEKLFSNFESLISKIFQQIILATLLIVVLGIVLLWERKPLSSIGLHQL
jgi:hypothetical protein